MCAIHTVFTFETAPSIEAIHDRLASLSEQPILVKEDDVDSCFFCDNTDEKGESAWHVAFACVPDFVVILCRCDDRHIMIAYSDLYDKTLYVMLALVLEAMGGHSPSVFSRQYADHYAGPVSEEVLRRRYSKLRYSLRITFFVTSMVTSWAFIIWLFVLSYDLFAFAGPILLIGSFIALLYVIGLFARRFDNNGSSAAYCNPTSETS